MFSNPYNASNKNKSRFLRKNSTPGEIALWRYLKNGNILGYKFRRQHSLLHYILDFYCIELKLGIEIDGSSHNEDKWNYDRKRETELSELGIKVIRFSEYETKRRTLDVVNSIEVFILRGQDKIL